MQTNNRKSKKGGLTGNDLQATKLYCHDFVDRKVVIRFLLKRGRCCLASRYLPILTIKDVLTINGTLDPWPTVYFDRLLQQLLRFVLWTNSTLPYVGSCDNPMIKLSYFTAVRFAARHSHNAHYTVYLLIGPCAVLSVHKKSWIRALSPSSLQFQE